MLTGVSNFTTYTSFALVIIYLITVSNLLTSSLLEKDDTTIINEDRQKIQTQIYDKSYNKLKDYLKEGGVQKLFLIIRRGVYWRETFKRERALIGGFAVNIRKNNKIY